MKGSDALGEGDQQQTNSLCAVYAELIEKELRSGSPDYERVYDMLAQIRENCQAVGFTPGETPEHLEEYQYDEKQPDTE
jgi:hypothetical protein